MPATPCRIIVTPDVAVSVTIYTAGGVTATAYTTENGSTAHSFPVSIAAGMQTTFWLPTPGQYKISALAGGSEIAGNAGNQLSVGVGSGGAASVRVGIDRPAEESVTAVGGPFVPLSVEGGIVSSSESDTSWSNNNTEQTLSTRATPTSPALTAGDRLILRAGGEVTNNTGSTHTVTMRFKIGSTTIGTFGISCTTSASARSWLLEVVIAVADPAAAQRANGILTLSSPGATTAAATYTFYGVSSEDLTTSKNVLITEQMDTASASFSITKHTASLERIAKLGN